MDNTNDRTVMYVLEDIVKEQRKIRKKDLEDMSSTIYKLIKIQKDGVSKRKLNTVVNVLDHLTLMITDAFSESEKLTKDEKLKTLKLLDEFSAQKDHIEVFLSKSSDEDIRKAGERLFQKSKSSLG